MNILISGLSGFIGTNFKLYLKSIKSKWVIKSLDRKLIYNPHLLKKDFNKIKIVLHLAGKAHDFRKTSASEEYYVANYHLTKIIFDEFLVSDAQIFIFLSSVKAAADNLNCDLTEEFPPRPITHYGKSKLLAEKYILNTNIPNGKQVYILRPCMIHGPGNKGNLNLVYNLVKKGFPWPLGLFENKRSFCSIDNLCFIIKELIENNEIPSGIYNIADDEALSTNDIISLISNCLSKKVCILNIPKFIIIILSKIGDILRLPLNTERLKKLTETFLVSNGKIKKAINKPFPMTAKAGLIKTFNSFQNNI